MYKLSVSDFLSKISEGLKRPITEYDVFSERIEIGHLKRIDKLFEKGIHYYLDPKAPENSKEASVFFRKESFGTDLNFRAKKIVSQFEELKISITAISKLAELDTERKIPKFSINDNPEKVANEFRIILFGLFAQFEFCDIDLVINHKAKSRVKHWWNSRHSMSCSYFIDRNKN